MKTIHCCLFTNCNYGLLSHCRHVVTHVEVVQRHLCCPFLTYQLLHVLLHSKYYLSSWSKCHMTVLSLSERGHSNEDPYLVNMVMFQNLLISSSEQHHPLCWQCDTNVYDGRSCLQDTLSLMIQCGTQRQCSETFL